MRIQIKVFLNKDKDIDCSGEKPDFFVTGGSFEDAEISLIDLKAEVVERELGIKRQPDDMSGATDNGDR